MERAASVGDFNKRTKGRKTLQPSKLPSPTEETGKIRRCKSVSEGSSVVSKLLHHVRSSSSESSFSEISMLDNDDDDDDDDDELVSKNSSGRKIGTRTPSGITFAILRFPILATILMFLLFELACYIFIRQTVRISTIILNFSSFKRRRYKQALREAETYGEWVKAGKAWDSILSNRKGWRDQLESPFYDYSLIAEVAKKLGKIKSLLSKESKKRTDATDQLTEEEKGLHRKLRRLLVDSGSKFDLGGIYHSRLYSHIYGQTKKNIENYVDQVSDCIKMYYDDPLIGLEEKRFFLKQIAKNYGRTALCLSGGGGFAYYHLGVVRTLIEQNCLPRVISGTSAGSVFAAFVCTNTDEEIMEMDSLYFTENLIPFPEPIYPRVMRLLREGNMVHGKDGLKVLLSIIGDLTFLEAFQKTGKVLNISVVSEESETSPSQLLNYLNTPNVIIASACLASCAIPGVVTAVPLLCKVERSSAGSALNNDSMERKKNASGAFVSSPRKNSGNSDASSKTFTGPLVEEFYEFVGMLNEKNRISGKNYVIVTFKSLGSFWRDGSFKSDIPIEKLQQLFNVHYTIVSQVNPFINLFMFDRHSYPAFHLHGDGFRGGFISSFLELSLKLDMRRWIRVIRHMYLLPSPSKLIPLDLSRFFLQPFHGDVTVHPPFKVKDYLFALSNPVVSRMDEYLFDGARMIWPKLALIRTRMKIERVIDDAMKDFKSKMQR